MADSKVRNSTGQEKEIWKPVKGYEGIYEVSNKARVRSYYKFKTGVIGDKPRLVKTSINNCGYPAATLCKNKEREQKHLHIMVAEIFVPNPKNNPLVCHKDDIKTNCLPENLYWGTYSDNIQDIYKNGNGIEGEKAYNSLFTETDVLNIRERCARGESQVDIANEYNVTRQSINLIVRGKNWAHVGGPVRAKINTHGENNSRAKLTEKDVLAIREDYKGKNTTMKSISERYCVHEGTISSIINRRTWKHI